MKYLLAMICALVLSATAQAATPTPESVSRLFELMRLEQTTAAVLGNLESMMRANMAQSLQGRTLTTEQTAQADATRAHFVEIIKDELSWEKMKPLNVEVYSETFTQEEVDGLIAFYRSAAGQAYVTKLPAAMQKSMLLMQQRMTSMLQKMMQAAREIAPASAPQGATP